MDLGCLYSARKRIPLNAGSWHFHRPVSNEDKCKRKKNTERQEQPMHGTVLRHHLPDISREHDQLAFASLMLCPPLVVLVI